MSRIIAITIFFATAMMSCYMPGRINRPNPDTRRSRNIQVDENGEKLTARIKLFYTTADTMRIYFILESRPQDYYLLNDKSKYRAAYTLSYEVTHNEKGKKVKTDSLSLQLVDLQVKPKSASIIAYVETKLPIPDQYAIKLTISNSKRNAKYDYYARFSNISCNDPENYILMTMDETPILDKNYIYSEGKIFKSKKCDAAIELYKIVGGVDYPTPPFAADDFASQNNYDKQLVSIVPEGNMATFSNLEKGIYSLQTAENSGIVFYHFTKWYPNCTDTAGFYDPMVYICSRAEFQELGSGDNPREKFEKYWLDRASDSKSSETYMKQIARKAINEYYRRVFAANAEYTSTNEGWKTDRGMISIIFGKPSYVERGVNREIWHYKTTFNATLTFTFNKIDNPYSDNDYRLQRDINYREQWYNAVGNWRRAKPFSLGGN